MKVKDLQRGETVVIALGGNAISPPGSEQYEDQLREIRNTLKGIRKLIHPGRYRLVFTHGNGPQVGDIFLQNELTKDSLPRYPLDVCGAQSQGLIGYMLVRELRNFLKEDQERGVSAILTQTLVDEDDPAFQEPTKPIGPFYEQEEAGRLKREEGYEMVEDAGRGYRRAVASPEPRAILECEQIDSLLEVGSVVVAAGGGGVPVINKEGDLLGREAVIDKDLASAVLAEGLSASLLLILTSVEYAYLNYGKKDQRPVKRADPDQVRRYMEEGHFAAGSMKPKMEAAARFIESGGKKALITSIEKAEVALEGKGGTVIAEGE